MKRLATILVVLLAIPAFAQDKAAQIADIQNQIAALEQTYAPLKDRLDKNDKLGDNIKFAEDAYTKQHEQFKQDLANFNTKQDNVNRGYELLKPSWDNYQQRKAQHNANQCVAHSQGECDWYNREADSIDAQRNQIIAAKQPLDQQQAQLDQQRGYLDQTRSKLQTIYDLNVQNYEKWKAEQDDIRNTYLATKAKIDQLEKQLAILYGSVNGCIREAKTSPTCQKPAIGPDGKPILNQDCERAVAACRSMFDGSK